MNFFKFIFREVNYSRYQLKYVKPKVKYKKCFLTYALELLSPIIFYLLRLTYIKNMNV